MTCVLTVETFQTPTAPADLHGIMSAINSRSNQIEQSLVGQVDSFLSRTFEKISSIERNIERGASCLGAHLQGLHLSEAASDGAINAYLVGC